MVNGKTRENENMTSDFSHLKKEANQILVVFKFTTTNIGYKMTRSL